jgi:hypothetical protein
MCQRESAHCAVLPRPLLRAISPRRRCISKPLDASRPPALRRYVTATLAILRADGAVRPWARPVSAIQLCGGRTALKVWSICLRANRCADAVKIILLERIKIIITLYRRLKMKFKLVRKIGVERHFGR